MADRSYVKEFEKLGFGMFVHFGLYSVYGKGEWAKDVYKIPDAQYGKLTGKFKVAKNWAKELVRTAKTAGAKYITLTTRHHDGFSLYDTCGLNTFDAPHSAAGRDLVRLFFAGLLGLVFNQCCYIIGLGITSPINASIVTTSAPIFAMVLSALILKEPITGKKAVGVLLGFSGALILILASAQAASSKVGDLRGDLLCLFAQFSFALYLALFRPLVQRYSVFTVNKWMFTFAAIVVLPFTAGRMAEIDYAATPAASWWEAAYVVVVGTFLCYILMMVGQRTLRPTVVSIYNYLQPVASVAVSVAMGLGVFGLSHAVAVALVFSGVWLVTKSKSRADIERGQGGKGEAAAGR